MSSKPRPVRDSIRQIDENTWLVGDKLVLSRSLSISTYLWKDANDWRYALSCTAGALPPSRPLPADSHIRLVYDAGDSSAVWRVGEAYCKVKLTAYDGITQEFATLNWLQSYSLSFDIPKVLYHVEDDDRSYIFVSDLPGQTLANAWPELNETDKSHYVRRVAEICLELANWKSDAITGVDGNYIPERYLTRNRQYDFSTEAMKKNCREIGMDCSKFVLGHLDLGPGNIIVRPDDKRWIGIIDWEVAGFVPLEWIRTKFRVSSGLDLPADNDEARVDWRKRVQIQLGQEGLLDVVDGWRSWRTANHRD